MEKIPFIVEMQKFRFGCKVLCSDGEEGILTHISFAASAGHCKAIGVRLGHFLAKTVYLPFAAIEAASAECIKLHITRAELSLASQQAPTDVLFDRKCVIQNTITKAQGTIELFAVHPQSGELAYLVTHGLRSGQDTVLRSEYIVQFQANLITMTASEAQLHAFPLYRSDDALQRNVEQILFDLALLHVDARGMQVRVLDGVLYLTGNVSSTLRGEMVADQSVGVVGLLGVKNYLIGDDQLASDLALVVGHDPRTRDLPIGMYPRLGVVRLSGAVHTAEQKAAVQEIAESFPGVRSVLNDLIIDANATLLNVMASATEGQAEDSVPGSYVRHTK